MSRVAIPLSTQPAEPALKEDIPLGRPKLPSFADKVTPRLSNHSEILNAPAAAARQFQFGRSPAVETPDQRASLIL